MVENQLSCEIIVSWCRWVEFEAHYSEALTINQTSLREGFECSSRVLQDLEVNWSITCVCDLKGLINRFIWTTTWEIYVFSGAHFDHWNEWLGAWWE